LRIFVVSDGPQHGTGYGQVGRSLCLRLVKDGHEVYCYGPGGFSNGQLTYIHKPTGLSWEVLAAKFGDSRGGSDGIPHWLEEYNPDLLITLLDPCSLEDYGLYNMPTWMWAPIDTWPINNKEAGILGRADKIFVPTQWGLNQLNQIGLNGEYIPYGLETSELYYDHEGRKRFRDALGIDDSIFLVGMIGAHYQIPDRKGFPYAFEAIKNLSSEHDNVKAFIFTQLKQNQDGYLDLEGVRDTMGLGNTVGFCRDMGPRYISSDEMRDMLCGFDVLLQPSMTEGFGLPVIEAQACGTPVVVNRATALTELSGPLTIGAEPAGSMMGPDGTLISIPDVNGITQALTMIYEDWESGKANHDGRWARDKFSWDILYDKHWRPLLSEKPKSLNLVDDTPRLVMGCGNKPKKGAVNHDLTIHSPFVDIAHDLNVFPYPWKDNEFAVIDCHDVLEHLSCNIIEYMNECWRILKPDGHLVLVTVRTGSWQHLTDPTHVRGFTLNSFDYFDRDTVLGEDYGNAYSNREWSIIKKAATPSGELLFIIKKIDNGVRLSDE
jgi:glycosyltransferase involved in cell wall biosynthesis